MAKTINRPVQSTFGSRPLALFSLGFVLLASAVSAETAAQSADQAEILRPYKAHYQLFRDGEEVGTATISLQSLGNERWRLVSDSQASVLLFSLRATETSEFILQGAQLQPQQFERRRELPTKTSITSQHFDWTAMRETGRKDKKQWTVELTTGTQDRQSHMLAIQHDVASGKTALAYTVSDGGKLRDYEYRVKGEETIETPYGKFKTLRIERERADKDRQTITWLAPALDYLPVRVQQIEDGEEQADMRLKALER